MEPEIYTHTKDLLKIQFGNAKLSNLVGHISLPAGFTCPGAKECLSYANRKTRKMTDGPETEFRCYAAGMEARYPAYHKIVWHNFDLINKVRNDKSALFSLLYNSIMLQHPQLQILRFGVSGDFYTQAQADAAMELADFMPNVLFYAYTKSVHLFEEHLDNQGTVRPNFMVTCSLGGKHDELVYRREYKYAKVVRNKKEADELGMECDHDDTHAMRPGPSFCQPIHGGQPAGSEWGKYARENGYNKSKKDPLIDIKTYNIWKEVIHGSLRTENQRTVLA